MHYDQITLAIIGPHGSGKTTIGKKVAQYMRWEYDEEIGRVLREQELRLSEDNHALSAQVEFDKKVMRLELERDLWCSSFRVVETWHPGNLAYARERSPEVANSYEKTLAKQIENFQKRLFVQPLQISKETALERLSEPGPDAEKLVSFFLKVAAQALQIAKSWNLYMLPTINTDRFNIKGSLDKVIFNLTNCGITPRACNGHCKSKELAENYY